jgi:hypothetical protein
MARVIASTHRALWRGGFMTFREQFMSSRGMVLLVTTLFLLAIGAQYLIKISDQRRTNRSAIQRWQPQILGLEQGEDISKTYQYPNPPIMSVLLLPLVRLPAMSMATIWYLAKVVMAILVLSWSFRLVDPARKLPWWVTSIIVLFSIRPIVGDLQHGNVNLFVFFVVMSSLMLVATGRSLLGGITMALAVSCKVTPLLFIPYFVWKREWKFLGGWVAGMALFLWPGIVPSLVLGYSENQRNLASWYTEMVHPFVVEGKVTTEHSNQSLPGLIFRLGTESPSFISYPDGVFTPDEFHHLISLSPRIAKLIVQASMLIFVAIVVCLCRPVQRQTGRRLIETSTWPILAAEWSFIFIGMLLFSERTWKHHAVTLALPWAVIVSATYNSVSPLTRRFCIVATIVAMAGMWITSTGLLDDRTAKLGQVYGGYTVAFISMACAIVIILREAMVARRSLANHANDMATTTIAA